MKRCTSCILPAIYPASRFDQNGVCIYCREKSPADSGSGAAALLADIRSLANGNAFDCVVPLSGGKDSSYILYYAVKKLGLKVIAVNYNSGFQSDLAKQNIRNTCQSLDVPLVIKTPKERRQKGMLKEILRVSETLDCFTRTCMNCECMLRTVSINEARNQHVPVVLWGSSPLESLDQTEYDEYRHGIRPMDLLRSKRATLKRLQLTPGKMARLLPRLTRYMALNLRQRVEMGVSGKCVLNPMRKQPFTESHPTFVHFCDYVTWDPFEIAGILRDELDWRHPEGRESRFDCRLFPFVDHRNLKLTGISEMGKISCSLIREGKMTRAQALEDELLRHEAIEQECRMVLDELGLANFRMPHIPARQETLAVGVS